MDIAVAKCFNEQESADKVESKFNIEKGKWYVCNTPRYTDFVVGKAYYCPKNGMLKPNENEIARYVAKDCFHLWTILDANGGDVLIHNKIPFIFMGIENGIVKGICAELSDTILNFGKPEYDNDYLPATKEQHDTLTKAMTDAGYTFDFEKKELRKIEQKFAWSREDENRFNNLIYLVENSNEGKGTKEGFIKFINRLKDLKDKAQTKQEWGEEDERNLNDAILFIETGTYSLDKDNLINWLKSLRPQNTWKPSDEQITWLYRAADDASKDSRMKQILNELLSDLKKLREE